MDYITILEKNKRIANIFYKIKEHPFRVIIIEGGDVDERLFMGKYFACCISCQVEMAPCLQCRVCTDILNLRSIDLRLLDGQEKTIKIEEVREIIREKDFPPREGPFKIFLFHEAQNLTQSAANSLLKILEEPNDKNLFVLLTPQKSNLIPTIVSRGVVFTLGWRTKDIDSDTENILKKLMIFLETKKGLFQISGIKVEKKDVESIILGIQKMLIDSFVDYSNLNEISSFFKKRITPTRLWDLNLILEKAHTMLNNNVSPKVVFEFVALNAYRILSKSI